MRVNNCQSQNYRKQNPVFKSRVIFDDSTKAFTRRLLEETRRYSEGTSVWDTIVTKVFGDSKPADVIEAMMERLDGFAKALGVATKGIDGEIIIFPERLGARQEMLGIKYKTPAGKVLDASSPFSFPPAVFLPNRNASEPYGYGIDLATIELRALLEEGGEALSSNPFAALAKSKGISR